MKYHLISVSVNIGIRIRRLLGDNIGSQYWEITKVRFKKLLIFKERLTPFWLPWWNVHRRSGMRHIHRKHINPHLDLTLIQKHTPTEQYHLQKAYNIFLNLKRLKLSTWRPNGTWSRPGRVLLNKVLVSMCSGTSLDPTAGISAQRWRIFKDRCS